MNLEKSCQERRGHWDRQCVTPAQDCVVSQLMLLAGEVNPAGEFAWIEEKLGLPLRDALTNSWTRKGKMATSDRHPILDFIPHCRAQHDRTVTGEYHWLDGVAVLLATPIGVALCLPSARAAR